MYTTRFCPYCIRARGLLQEKGIRFSDIAVDNNRMLRQQMEQRSGRHTVPQIWVGERHIGGFDDLWALEQRGQLDPLLQTTDSIET